MWFNIKNLPGNRQYPFFWSWSKSDVVAHQVRSGTSGSGRHPWYQVPLYLKGNSQGAPAEFPPVVWTTAAQRKHHISLQTHSKEMGRLSGKEVIIKTLGRTQEVGNKNLFLRIESYFNTSTATDLCWRVWRRRNTPSLWIWADLPSPDLLKSSSLIWYLT